MSKIIRPAELPDCKIINALIEKANVKGNYEFNYAHYLDELRKRVSIEVSRINLLFPEYTPHDEKYHLKRLFFVADELLGDDLIQSMNATELFLLSVSLYAHDWGMAVSEEEKEFIVSSDKIMASNFNLLDNEQLKFKEYCKSKNIDVNNISTSDWQEYIRLTHAFRSGKRVKSFFEKLSTGTGEFASRICEGHYLDFDIIEDHISYPTDCSIHLDVVNVKALTVYVRLIDLLDIGEDRTPFILWKFVSPRNKFSKLEWSKHRAIQPVTFPNYQLGRYVQIDAGTDDIDVYMSIMDLKRYVDDQFRGCSNILNRMNHPYHKLNISHIDWRVAPKGFKPIQIQFEFDRNRMFDILSDEIYQSDPYVFVRELIQNAIDAIRMRIEILAKKDISFTGKIHVDVINHEDYYIISIKDNGIGMDEYIIRNYLSVAGKSYYRSADFQKEGLKMEPISRFGIGVLSCFMVADYMEIYTHREPYFSTNSERLKITIPSRENHFRIEQLIEQVEVGSSFKVFVSKSRLPKNKKTEKTIELQITEYLKHVTAFVPFPIIINENGKTTNITNPNIISSKPGDNPFAISYEFPISKAIRPQNVATAKEFFEEKQINLRTDLKLSEFDGCLTYLLPKKRTFDIINIGRSWPTSEVKVIDYEFEFEKENRIKWNEEWIGFSRRHKNEEIDIPALKNLSSFSIYLDGILIQDISHPEISISDKTNKEHWSRYGGLHDSFLCPQLIANIPKPQGMKLDLARTKIASDKKWDFPIWEGLSNYLKTEYKQSLEDGNLQLRLLSLGQFKTFYALPDDFILEGLINHDEFPIPAFTKESKIVFKLFSQLDKTINLPPLYSNGIFYNYIKNLIIKKETKNTMIENWIGGEFLMEVNRDDSENQPASIINMLSLLRNFLKSKYYLNRINFLSSPLGTNYPIVQEELVRFDFEKPYFNDENSDFFKEISLDKSILSSRDLYYINGIIRNKTYSFPKIVYFPKPFHEKVFYSYNYINIGSSFGKTLVEICLAIIKIKSKGNYDKEKIDGLYDEIEKLPFMRYSGENKNIKFAKLTKLLNEIITDSKKLGLITTEENKIFELKPNDFVENSIILNKDSFSFTQNIYFSNQKSSNKWGEIIS